MANDTAAREPKRSRRTCAGCGEAVAPEDLVRVVAGPPSEPDGARPLAVDLLGGGGGAGGRGAHVHPTPSCLARACRGGFARSFRCRVVARADELAAQIVASAERRVQGLILGARRAKRVAVGADAAREALAKGAPLVVLAADAGTIATQKDVAAVAGQGKAAVFGRKQSLGALLGRDEVAIVAVLDPGLASEIRKVLFLADALRGGCPGGDNGRLEV